MAHPLALRRARAMLIPVLLMVGGACKDWAKPVAPSQDTRPVTTAATQSGPSVFKDGVHILDPAQIEILSGPEERRDGIWRLRSRTGEALTIGPGEFILAWIPEEGLLIRQVTGAAAPLGDLELQTEEGYWPQILNGGTRRYSVPLTLEPNTAAGDLPNIPLDLGNVAIAMDFCKGEGLPPTFQNIVLCNLGASGGVGNDYVKLKGNVSELKFSGFLAMGGNVDFALNIDPGRITYDPSIYYPCNEYPSACGYTGFCFVGTQVLIGLWPPLWATCRREYTGQGFVTVPPSLGESGVFVHPMITADLTVSFKGSASLEITVPIPNASFKRRFTIAGDTIGEVELGLFIVVSLELKTTATAHAFVDKDIAFSVAFDTTTKRWQTNATVARDTSAMALTFDDPEVGITVSFVPRVIVKFSIIPLPDFMPDSLKGKVAVGAELSPALGATYSETPSTNWHVDVDGKISVDVSAGIELPLNWKKIEIGGGPNWKYDLYKLDVADLWGRGDVQVDVLVSGVDADDAFTLSAIRVDPDSDPVYANSLQSDIPISGGRGGLSLLSRTLNPGAHCTRGPRGWPVPPPPAYSDCDLAAEPHYLSLDGVAPNCRVGGMNPRVVTPSSTAREQFMVTCQPADASTSLRVNTSTSGGGAAFTVVIDGVSAAAIPANGSVLVTGLDPGTLSVGLDDVASCTVLSANPADVDAAAGDTASITFDVDCASVAGPRGWLQIVTRTSGPDPDPNGYIVQVDGRRLGPAMPNGTSVLFPLQAKHDEYELLLTDVEPNCAVVGENPRFVSIRDMATTQEQFDVLCRGPENAGDLSVIVLTVGDLAPAGYRIRAGRVEAPVGARDTVFLTGLPEGDLRVALLAVPAECAVTDPNPQDATIVRNTTAEILFRVFCTPGGVGSSSLVGITTLESLLGTSRVASMSAVPSMTACWMNAEGRPENRSRILEGHLARMFALCFLPQAITEHRFEVGFQRGLEGRGTFTRTMALDGQGGGGVVGEIEMDVNWNGIRGVFRGLLAGTVARKANPENGLPAFEDILVANVTAVGQGAFQGLILTLEMSGKLQGPLAWTGTVRPATSR